MLFELRLGLCVGGTGVAVSSSHRREFGARDIAYSSDDRRPGVFGGSPFGVPRIALEVELNCGGRPKSVEAHVGRDRRFDIAGFGLRGDRPVQG